MMRFCAVEHGPSKSVAIVKNGRCVELGAEMSAAVAEKRQDDHQYRNLLEK